MYQGNVVADFHIDNKLLKKKLIRLILEVLKIELQKIMSIMKKIKSIQVQTIYSQYYAHQNIISPFTQVLGRIRSSVYERCY